MDPQDRIDLSSVNQPKPAPLQPQQPKKSRFSNPFRKKSAGPGRDHLGQFTSGGGGLRTSKKFNWSRALPLVAVISLVGGYLVYRSFAGTSKLYDYQYSAWQCGQTAVAEPCLGKSAEAFTHRAYLGLLKRDPSTNELKHWTQKLAGDRMRTNDMINTIVISNEFIYGPLNSEQFIRKAYTSILGYSGDAASITYWKNRLDSKSSDKLTRDKVVQQFAKTAQISHALAHERIRADKNYVENLYKNLLGRNGDAAGVAYWKKEILDKNRTRSEVAHHFIRQDDVKSFFSQRTKNYVSSKPKVAVVPVARQQQEKRAAEAAYINTNSLNVLKAMSEKVDKSDSSARNTYYQYAIRTTELNRALTGTRELKNYLSLLKDRHHKGKIDANYNEVKKRYETAKAVNKYSPDIEVPSTLAQAFWNAAQYKDKVARPFVDHVQLLFDKASEVYAVMKKKYDAGQMCQNKDPLRYGYFEGWTLYEPGRCYIIQLGQSQATSCKSGYTYIRDYHPGCINLSSKSLPVCPGGYRLDTDYGKNGQCIQATYSRPSDSTGLEYNLMVPSECGRKNEEYRDGGYYCYLGHTPFLP